MRVNLHSTNHRLNNKNMEEFNSNTNSNKNLKKKLITSLRSLYKPVIVLLGIPYIVAGGILYANRGHFARKLPDLYQYLGLTYDTFQISDFKEYKVLV